MNEETKRFFCINDELDTSRKLIEAGFGSLQEIDMGNDFYHMPHQLIASGFERLMKCYISLVFKDRVGSYPNQKQMKRLGHDLVDLLNKICNEYYGGKTRPLIQKEFDFLTTDQTLRECIRILSEFGKYGRYYNLDIVAGSSNNPIDPKSEWESLESKIEDITPFLNNTESLYQDYYPRVHSKILAKLERFVRAIAFQFTVGDHPDEAGLLRQTSIVYTDFRNIQDEDLGKKDYRQSVRLLQQKKEGWVKRSQTEILDGKWPKQIVMKEEFGDEWPFRGSRAIIECRENLFCIVNIEGYAFALNGAAGTRFNYPNPHDAGMAVLGKSVGPFIDIALSLREEK